MGVGRKLLVLASCACLGLSAATQYVAWNFRWPVAFGAALDVGHDIKLYPPYGYLVWRKAFGDQYPEVWSAGLAFLLVGVAIGACLIGLLNGGSGKAPRVRGWGTFGDARAAGLTSDIGCVLGQLGRRLLTTDDLRPTLVTGGTRSGKGRGHVVPSLLAWMQSVLVHDPKGELWRLTAGCSR